jgi:prephenate dehydratase
VSSPPDLRRGGEAAATGHARAAYLGPPGTFSEEALLASAGDDVDPAPLATVHDVVLAVQEGRVERGLVPIESASEGSVDATLDALAADAPDVIITGEVVRAVRHALVAPAGVGLADVAVVVSHPQALAQCARFLRETLPGARAVAWTSTAEAVRAAGERRDEGWAAIGTPRAAGLYGCEVLRDGVEDHAGNATRFVWLARGVAGAGPADGDGRARKTSLLFAGAGTAQPGWLVRCLSELAFRGVNLTRIESRPRKDRLGDHLFFVDCAGAVTDEGVRGAVDGLRAHCDLVRVLGSYPAA